MKKIILLALIASAQFSLAQTSCCSKPASTETFAMLTHDKKFINAHLEPLPFTLTDQLGKDITFKTSDGKEGHGYEIKSEKFTNNYLFVFQEWWGLNDYIKQEAEKYFKTLGHVNVIAIDLYDKKVATSRDSAAKYMQSATKERCENIIKGALSYVGEKANIATVGWCFGGGWSLQASLLAGTKARACVMFYGMPEQEEAKLENVFCPTLMIWPTQDKWINKDVVTQFEASMQKLHKDLKVKSYNADHAFANPSNPKYNKEFADDAFKNAITFIKKHLK
jgi:carboxymethylenebutenolidase